ncbi:MAG: DNA mismatch repair protein MutS [Desulfurellaceae bacterium]|nr:DNA mismatch repair protein MutS [Desulfurellaceae bacterium]
MALSPTMQYYRDTKQEYPDAIVLLRLGDFYEIFFEDAREAAALLDLTLTSRGSGPDRIPMCGVPYHAVQGYIARLVKAGRKVAICDQLEDPKTAKGLVKRGVTRVVTPSTFVESEDDPGSPSLLGLSWTGTAWGVAWLEPATGLFQFWEAGPDALGDALDRVGPSEMVTTKSVAASPLFSAGPGRRPGTVVTRLDDWHASAEDSRSCIQGFYGLDSLRALELSPATTGAVALVLRFLHEHMQVSLPHVQLPRRLQQADTMQLGAVVERSLELFQPATLDTRGTTLLDVLDETLTPMGKRLLRRWMRSPLLSIEAIQTRHAAVEELVRQPAVLESVRRSLAPVRDLERLLARFSARVATPKDAAGLRDSLAQLPELVQTLHTASAELLRAQRAHAAADLSRLRTHLERGLVDIPPVHTRDGGVFAEGYDAELDRLRSLSADAKQWLAALQAREGQRTGIANLKIGYNRVFGYFLEVAKSQLSKVPPDYTRRQTLANAERFVTAELKEHEDQILNAEERATALEHELFDRLCGLVLDQLREMQAVAVAVAQLDMLACFAWVALRQRYVRPEMCDEPVLSITGGRHPVVETVLEGKEFVENDLLVDRDAHQLLLLTAPNMSGKSVYLRQAALIVLLAQMGSFVPASAARIGIVDRIFTRIGASDNLSLGESTFAVEMIEAAQILNYATPRSLLLLDEIGRGTSTSDGLSIARAIIEFLVDRDGPRPRTLFATHFHELSDLHQLLPGLENHTFAVREWKSEVVFLYRVVPGAADQSYGIHVAKLAGLPGSVISRAQEVLADLEARGVQLVRPRRRVSKPGVAEPNPGQLGLFGDGREP